MMWNPYKRWKENRKKKKLRKDQFNLLQTWAWLESIFESGMLSFDEKEHRLFILQPMAVLLMAKGAEGWVNSIHSIYQYLHWRQTQKEWEKFFQKEELAAVRMALNGPSGDKLTNEDIERIKRSRRAEIASSDMEAPKVEPFEFFIIPNSTEAKVEPIGIGYYDPNTGEMEVAAWEEVKSSLSEK